MLYTWHLQLALHVTDGKWFTHFWEFTLACVLSLSLQTRTSIVLLYRLLEPRTPHKDGALHKSLMNVCRIVREEKHRLDMICIRCFCKRTTYCPWIIVLFFTLSKCTSWSPIINKVIYMLSFVCNFVIYMLNSYFHINVLQHVLVKCVY